MRAALLVTVAASLSACAPPARVTTAPAATSAGPARAVAVRPPIRGGTLLATRDLSRAVVSDPDHAAVWVVSLDDGVRIEARIDLEERDEPFRLAEDDGGRVHVVLAAAGEVAVLDLERAEVIARHRVCASPRGIAWESAERRSVVACAGGELWAVTGAGSTKLRTLAPDLRDVWTDRGGLAVSRFRAAEIHRVSSSVAPVIAPPPAELPSPMGADATFAARVAWRTVADPTGEGAWMLHQRHMESPQEPGFGAIVYGSLRAADDRVVKPALTYIEPEGIGVGIVLGGGVLPVDIAPSPDGSRVAVAFAARGGIASLPAPGSTAFAPDSVQRVDGERHAAAVAWSGPRLLAQFWDPPMIAMYEGEGLRLLGMTTLGSAPAIDHGRELFHRATTSGVACASCHPEASDDGHVWRFPHGPRRTQTLTAGVLSMAPFHWSGEHESLGGLMQSVFVARMGGLPPTPYETEGLGSWLHAQPPPRFDVEDRPSVERGERLFRDPIVGCESCHSGPLLTDNRGHDVGTGGFFQTPSLVGLRARAPYFHDGCADTIEARFERCHTPDHGVLTGLTPAQIADMVAYLGSL